MTAELRTMRAAFTTTGQGLDLSLDSVIQPPEWMIDGLCAQVDPEIFFPDKGGTTRPAKSICNGGCPVRTECLAYALERGERFGIWGGAQRAGAPQVRARGCSRRAGTRPCRRACVEGPPPGRAWNHRRIPGSLPARRETLRRLPAGGDSSAASPAATERAGAAQGGLRYDLRLPGASPSRGTGLRLVQGVGPALPAAAECPAAGKCGMTATVIPIRPDLPGEAGERLTGPQLCVLAGISYRQLDFWTRTGKLRPHGPDKSDTGRYSESEARIAGLMKRLLDVGFCLRDAASYARRLVETGQQVELAGGLVRIDPAEVAL